MNIWKLSLVNLKHLLISCIILLLPYPQIIPADVLVGATAPDFQGLDLQGKPYRLSDYRNKIVVLEWSSPECPYSGRYYSSGVLPGLQKFASDNDVVWINVIPRMSKLKLDDVRDRIDTSGKLVIFDQSLDISTLYRATTTPQIYIIDQQGKLVYSGAIDSNAMMKKMSGKVTPYARKALQALLAGEQIQKRITNPYGCMVRNNDTASEQQAYPPIISSDSR